MFLLWRVVKTLIRLILLVVVLLAGFMAWALLWPAPSSVHREHCAGAHTGCVAASGRVLYHTGFGRHRAAHLILISSKSTTLPGIVTVAFPAALTRAPAGLGFGDWISVEGRRTTGAQGEQEIRVAGLATTKTRIRCGASDHRRLCTRVGS